MRTLPSTLILLLAVCFSACGGGKEEAEQKQQDNLTCETECASDSLSESVDCQAEGTSCIGACSGPEDEGCIDQCEHEELICGRGLVFCAANCPCFEEMGDCTAQCTETDCVSICRGEYDECAKDGSAYFCVIECDNDRFDCAESCKTSATSLSELVACRQVCDDKYEPCHAACAE